MKTRLNITHLLTNSLLNRVFHSLSFVSWAMVKKNPSYSPEGVITFVI